MEQKHSLWKEQYPIRFYEVGSDKRLTVPHLCNFIQNSSANHINHLGVGIDDLNKNNHTWMLSRLLIQIDQLPEWQNEASLSTWQVCKHKLFAIRDYLLEGNNGKVLAKASASWLVIDLERRRPIPCGSYVQMMNPLGHLRSLDGYADKVDDVPSGGKRTPIKVHQSDIDINGHVNNVKYLEWFFNQMNLPATSMDSPIEVEVNFLGESFMGDELEIFSFYQEEEKTWLHSLYEVHQKKELCRARIQLTGSLYH